MPQVARTQTNARASARRAPHAHSAHMRPKCRQYGRASACRRRRRRAETRKVPGEEGGAAAGPSLGVEPILPCRQPPQASAHASCPAVDASHRYPPTPPPRLPSPRLIPPHQVDFAQGRLRRWPSSRRRLPRVHQQHLLCSRARAYSTAPRLACIPFSIPKRRAGA